MSDFTEKLQELHFANTPFIAVILVDARGSAPQDPGSKMLVTGEGLYYGTVGGGKLEARALAEAQEILNNQDFSEKTRFTDWNLNTDIGMTCGGSVRLFFEAYNRNTWEIAIFGAGHVASALVRLLVHLDCRITCFDPRPEWLEKLPQSAKLKKLVSSHMPSEVPHLPNSAFVILVTMGHGTDKPILLEILKTNRRFPYLGVIGSRAKAARLKQDIEEAGLPEICKDMFYCPIGLEIGSNHPQEIAISIAAQLLRERDRLWEPRPAEAAV